MTGQPCEVVTNLHLSPLHSVAASWVVTGQNQSLGLFLSAFLEETGQSLKPLPSVSFFVEETGQSLNHVCSELFLPLATYDCQVNVFYLMRMGRAFFCKWGKNLTKN